MGAGHDGAAREMRTRLEAQGYDVEVRDYLKAVRPVGWLVKTCYGGMLKRVPRSYDWLYWALARGGLVWSLTKFLCTWARPALRRWLACGADVVVSTYPLASQTLGQLRARRELGVPLVTFLTDFSVHHAWVHPHVDLHLANSDPTARQARHLGASRVVVAGPLVPGRFRQPSADARRGALRAELGLPAGPLALLSAGSWGVGEVAQTAREILATGAASPVVVCGRNETLRRELSALPGIVALGWTDRMADLMAVTDVLVQNAGGLSCMEAFATGLPVLSYRSIPGHGQHNAETMEAAGVAAWVRDPADLGEQLRAALAGGGEAQRRAAAALFRSNPAGEVDLLVRDQGLPAFVPTRQRRTRRTAGALVASVAILWGSTGGVAMATSRGIGVVQAGPAHAQDVFVVVRPDAGTAADPVVLGQLRQLGAGVVVGRHYLARQAPSVARIRSSGLPLVELGSKSVRLPVRGAKDPLVLVADRQPDAVDIGLKWLHDDRLLVPSLVVRTPADAAHVAGGSIVLVDARGQTREQLHAELAALQAAVAAHDLRGRPVTDLVDAAT